MLKAVALAQEEGDPPPKERNQISKGKSMGLGQDIGIIDPLRYRDKLL